jgi:hypothetical protein
MPVNKKPFALYILVILLFIQGISALYGGFGLVFDPTGKLIQLPDGTLEKIPFSTFLFPGLILGTILGILPLLLIYPLLTRPHWKWARFLNIYRNRHWAWTYSLYVGLGVIIWMDVQIFFIGYTFWIQAVTAVMGLLITIFTLMPGVMAYYRRSRKPKKKEQPDNGEIDD